ncbi:MAG: FAD-dependent oxidoreductase [Thermodesulfobacteriota bacterium]
MDKQRVLIIGAVALGPKVACRLKRLRPDDDVLMIDQDELISYGGCGIPYFISGDVSDVQALMSTSFHMPRTPKFFAEAKGVRVMNLTRALAIDRAARTVRVRHLDSGSEEELPYDRLVLATGARPRRLAIPGIDLPGVRGVANIHDAVAIKERMAKGEVGRVVVIGAGAIGCEMAEAFTDLWGIETTLVEVAPSVLPGILDPSLGRMVRRHLEEKGVTVRTGETVQEIRPGAGGAGLVVATGCRELAADLVLTAVGVVPNGELAAAAGLTVSPRGAVMVNARLETSDPRIFAGGDCIEVQHLISGRPFHFPQGSLANRQGRIIGTNLAGGHATFPGSTGAFCLRVFDMAVASAGLSFPQARQAGFDAVKALVIQADRAHFFPGMDLMSLQLVVDKKSRRVLGVQGVSGNGDALTGRIDAIAALLPHRPTVEDLSNLEVAYSPPYASAMDIVNAVANTAENILDGLNRTAEVEELEELFIRQADPEVLCLDVRGPANAAPFVARFGARWQNIPQETLHERLHEIPRDKKLFVVCNSGVRSYEALRQLDHAGLGERAVNLQGGVAALKKSGALDAEPEAAGS